MMTLFRPARFSRPSGLYLVKAVALVSLAFFTLAALPARAQSGYGGYGGSSGSSGASWQVVPCNSDGSTPVNSSSGYGYGYGGNGFQTLKGTQSGTASNTYPQAMKDLAKNSQYAGLLGSFGPSDETAFPYLPAPPATVPAKIFTGYYQQDGIGLATDYSGIWADNGTYPILDADGHPAKDSDGNPLTGNINGGVTTDVSGHLSGYYKVYYGWSYMPNMPMMPPANQPMPDHINLLVSTNLYVHLSVNPLQLWDQGDLTATGTASASGDSITVSADGRLNPYASQSLSKYHLRSIPVVPIDALGGIATVSVDGSTHSDASNSVPYIQKISVAGYGVYSHTLNAGANAWNFVQAGAEQDNREVTIIPLGHEVTNHKGFQKNSDGSLYHDPVTNLPVPFAEPNKVHGDSLTADIAIPYKAYPEAIQTYSITYQPQIHYGGGLARDGDSFNFEELMKGLSESGTLPLSGSLADRIFGGTVYALPVITADYHMPYVYYDQVGVFHDDIRFDKDHPHLAPQDTSTPDNVDLTYNFVQDGAQAQFHLDVLFHLPYENWHQVGKLQGDEERNTPYEDVETEPAVQKGGLAVTTRVNQHPSGIAFAYQGASAVLTGASVLLADVVAPEVAAFIAVTGYIADKASPENPPISVPDGPVDFVLAITKTGDANKPGGDPSQTLCNDSQWMAQWKNLTDLSNGENVVAINGIQGNCTYELKAQTWVVHFHYLGDHYGGSGYIEEAKTDVLRPESPHYLHYYTAPVAPVSTTPIAPQ